MKVKVYLVSKGLTEEQATAVSEGMPGENFYLATEENLDERYTKMKQQKEQLETDLKTANELVNNLEKSNKSNEELQTQIDSYKTELETLNTQRAEDRKNAAIELALTAAGAKNIKAAKALLDLEGLEVTENGLKGLDAQLEGIKKDNDYLFQNEQQQQTPKIVTGGNPQGGSNEPVDAFQAAANKYI